MKLRSVDRIVVSFLPSPSFVAINSSAEGDSQKRISRKRGVKLTFTGSDCRTGMSLNRKSQLEEGSIKPNVRWWCRPMDLLLIILRLTWRKARNKKKKEKNIKRQVLFVQKSSIGDLILHFIFFSFSIERERCQLNVPLISDHYGKFNNEKCDRHTSSSC